MPKITVIFRSRLNQDHLDDYLALAEKMDAVVQTIPGFIAKKSFKAEDGERVTIAEFASEAAVQQWKKS